MPPENVVAVARQESGLHVWAIRDEATNRSYYPSTLEEAEALATRLTAQGHLLGIGLMQLTPPSAFSLSIRQALDPCTNLRAGAQHLADHYQREREAMRRALSRYNTGRPDSPRGAEYSRRVEAQAARIPLIAPDSAPRPPALAAPPAPPADPLPIATTARRGTGREIAFTRQP